jgi:surfeit locus 1 family protein
MSPHVPHQVADGSGSGTRRQRWRRIVVAVAAVLVAALCTRLGLWQLDRAAQKLALQARIEARGAMPPLANAELTARSQDAAAQYDRRAVVRGTWVPAATVFLDNRQMGGVPGFYVVTPLRLEGRTEALAIERGWVPRDFRDRSALPPFPTPAGTVAIEGRVAPPPARLYAFGPEASGPIRQNLDLGAYAGETGVPLLPLSLLQTGPAAAGEILKRDWPAPALDVQKHYGYAGQWFIFAALTVGLYAWFQLVRPRIRRR